MKQITEGFVKGYINQSLWSIHVAFFILLVCLLFSIPYGHWIIIPFLLISIVSYFHLRFYTKKWNDEIKRSHTTDKKGHFKGDDVIVIQQKDTIHFLNPNGPKIGSVKKTGRNGYCFYNEAEFPLFFARKKAGHKLLLTIQNHHQQQHAVYDESERQSVFYHSGKLCFQNQTLSIKRKHHHAFSFLSENGLEVATIEKGWMPTEWQKRFSANAPVVQFHSSINEDQKKIFMLLVGIFMLQSI